MKFFQNRWSGREDRIYRFAVPTLLAVALSGGFICCGEADELATRRRCDSERAQGLKGLPYNERLESLAKELTGAKVVRVIKAGEPTTMEFGFDRVTVQLDGSGIVTDVRCG